MGLFDFFNKAKSTFNQSALTKEKKEEVERLARGKKLRESVNIAEEMLSQWSDNSFFGEQIARNFFLGEILEDLESQLSNWKNIINQTEQKAIRAKKLVASDTGDPFETEAIIQAINLYQQCINSVIDKGYQEALTSLRQKLEWRQRFQKLLSLGEESARKGFYKQSLVHFLEAQKLFNIAKVQKFIAFCQSKIPQEESYEAQLYQARQIATEGRFQEAFVNFKAVFKSYPRSDGKKLLQELQRVLKGKKYYHEGLIAERKGFFSVALTKYKEAEKLTPELTDCKKRLAIVAVKSDQYSQALFQLEGIEGEEVAYLRGFIYAKQGKLQQADREWKSITHFDIQPQREFLKTVVRRTRLQALQKIEQLVDTENLEAAKSASLEFISKYGVDPTVESNLEGHIQPRLDNSSWESPNWQKIVSLAEETLLQQQNIVCLHNWAIASYYQAQINSDKLQDWITAWFTTLANIHLDPSLQNVPWLESRTVDLEDISSKLIQKLEAAIDGVKDSDLEEYYRLRDLYRLDKVALSLMGNPPACGLRVKSNLFIPPNCYQRHLDKLPQVEFPEKTWGALYTQWGKAVAACLEGDVSRAILIQPQAIPNTKAEYFGRSLVSYYEGGYYLQNHNWRKAVTPLKIAKQLIKNSEEYQEEIDYLCQKQRKQIKNDQIEENLQFAQFWYDLLATSSAKAYLVEYKTEKIRQQWLDDKITHSSALRELNSLKKIDANNPVLLDLIDKVEFFIEADEINQLINRNQFEEAVKRATRSRHEQIRSRLAEMFVEILVEGGLKKRELGFQDIYDLSRWAYELCPDDPGVAEIYQFGLELKQINDLMRRERFDEAVRRAKYSHQDFVRYYVAEFFIRLLLQGAESQNIDPSLIIQLGNWAYELCPNEPDFQPIYSQLGIYY